MRNPTLGLLVLAVALSSCSQVQSPAAVTAADTASAARQPEESGSVEALGRRRTAPTLPPAPAPAPVVGIKPPPGGKVVWDWQIGAEEAQIRVPTGTTVLDIDGFGTSAATVARLKSAGIYTVCYISAGTWEDWRPDAARYPAGLKLASVDGWAGEQWIDTRDVFRSGSTLAPILRDRLKMCKDKGFDALEPDNLDAYQNIGNGGTVQDARDFATWIADEAHAVGLAVLQKNLPDQTLGTDRRGRRLVDVFDGILNEQCQQYAECAGLGEYGRRGKLALNVEYRSDLTLNCTNFAALGVSAMKRDLGLVAPGMSGYLRQTCP